MTTDPRRPFELCGCIRVATKQEALLIQRMLRQSFKAGGFSIKHVQAADDGSVTERMVAL